MNNTVIRRLRCSECGAVFNPWEEIFSWSDGGTDEYVCSDCFDALFDELTRYERAALIGSEIKTAETLLPS